MRAPSRSSGAKRAGEHYLKIVDDGDGIPQDAEGRPNFKYVATHICDSIKRQLKAEGRRGSRASSASAC